MGSVATYSFKQFLIRNLALKLLCLATAISIWSLASISRNTSVEIAIPLKLDGIPAGLMTNTRPPAVISYTLSGPFALINTARRSNSVVNLSLKGAAGPGKTLFMNLESYLKLPEGIKVIRISPATLEIELKPEHLSIGDQHP